MFKYLPQIATAENLFAASENVFAFSEISLKIISHMKREGERRYQAIADQSGASACLLSFDYHLQGISENKIFHKHAKDPLCVSHKL